MSLLNWLETLTNNEWPYSKGIECKDRISNLDLFISLCVILNSLDVGVSPGEGVSEGEEVIEGEGRVEAVGRYPPVPLVMGKGGKPRVTGVGGGW